MESVRTDGAEVTVAAVAEPECSGTVNWTLEYGELESCCLKVSAGEESDRSVVDVVVEVTARREKETSEPNAAKL